MYPLKIAIFLIIPVGFLFPFSPLLSSDMDEVICQAMKGMVLQQSKKIPFNVKEYSVVGLSVDCENKTLTTEKKHTRLRKNEFESNFQKIHQKNWQKTNCSNMIFNKDTGWSTEQLVKGKDGLLVSKVKANFKHCSK